MSAFKLKRLCNFKYFLIYLQRNTIWNYAIISNLVIWHLLQRKIRQYAATFLPSPKEMPKRLLIRDGACLWNGNVFLFKNGLFFFKYISANDIWEIVTASCHWLWPIKISKQEMKHFANCYTNPAPSKPSRSQKRATITPTF